MVPWQRECLLKLKSKCILIINFPLGHSAAVAAAAVGADAKSPSAVSCPVPLATGTSPAEPTGCVTHMHNIQQFHFINWKKKSFILAYTYYSFNVSLLLSVLHSFTQVCFQHKIWFHYLSKALDLSWPLHPDWACKLRYTTSPGFPLKPNFPWVHHTDNTIHWMNDWFKYAVSWGGGRGSMGNTM